MSYLGRGLEQVDNISKLDNLTFNGGTTYALTKDSAAFTPISSNALLISIDGVIQQGNFSVSGTNIVFNFSPTGSNTCDFILHYGTGVAFTPADNSITKDKTNFVSTSSSAGLEIKGDGTTDGTLQLSCSQGSHGIKLKSPAHSTSSSYTLTFPGTDPAADKMLQTDGSGNLSFVDAPSAGLNLLLDTTLSNSASFTADNTILTTTYKKYIIDCVNLELQSQSHVALTGSSNNGSSYISSGYQYTNFIMTSSMSNNEYYTRMNNSASAIDFVGNAQTITNDKHIDARIELYNPTGGNDYKRVLFHAGYSNTSNQEITVMGTGTFGGGIGTDALNNIKIAAGTGNLKSGSIKVYGVL